MNSPPSRIRNAIFAIALVAVASLFSGGRSAAQGASELTAQEERGKQFYEKGESANGEAVAILSGDLELPAASFPCANCHGMRGEGGKEEGIQPPPLDWTSLTSRHRSALTRNERPPYNEATLARAISSGVDSGGARLHPGMPRFKMALSQMADLIAYLKKIGKETGRKQGTSN